MELFCAIDLLEGQAVRLVHGDFSQRHDFGDPLELARRYCAGGARWLHVVDLDAARTGEPVNRELVLAIGAETDLSVQTGGGVRTRDDAEALLSGGVQRVVLGTAAQRDRALLEDLCTRHPGRVVVGLDHRGGGKEVVVQGWEEGAGSSLSEAFARLEHLPLAGIAVTAIERDGALRGPDVGGLREALGHTEHGLIASGGVRSVEDLRALVELESGGHRLAGVIVGMALVDGTLGVEEAVRACETSG